MRTRLPILAVILAVVGCVEDVEPPVPDDSLERITFSGQVVDYPEGEPIADVAVVVFDVQARYRMFYTDEDGRYEAIGMRDIPYRAKAWPLDGQDYIGAYFDDTYFYCLGSLLYPGQDEPLGPVNFRLPHGATIRGTITDAASGDPIENARVDVRGMDYYNANLDPTAYTDENGEYSIVGLDSAIDNIEDANPVPGNYELKVSVPGRPVIYYPGVYSSAELEPVLAIRNQTTSGVDLAIPVGATVTGTITDEVGTPLESGTVTARNATETWIMVYGSLGPGGAYTLGGMIPGTHTLQVTSAGYAGTALEDQVEVGEDEVVDGVDAALVEQSSFQGVVQAGGELMQDVALRALPVTAGVDNSGTSAEDGAFSIDELAAGAYRIHVVSPDDRFRSGYLCAGSLCPFLGDADAVEVGTAEQRQLGTLSLPPASIIEGRVAERESGRPLGRIYVTLLPEDETLATPLQVTTEDGSFRFGGLAAGSYRLQAEPYRYCSGDPGWTTTFSGGGRRIEDAVSVYVGEGAALLEDLYLPVDDDGDAMADVWERLHFLDSSRDDSLEDPDQDGVFNLDEYLEGTNPRDVEEADGCNVAPSTGAGPGMWVAVLALLAAGRRSTGVQDVG